MTSVVDREFWHEGWSSMEPDLRPETLGFRDLFDRYFPPEGSCFEVGCYPGRFLAYVGKRFGYTVNGIDWVPLVRTQMPEFLRRNGVRLGEFYCEDFEGFRCDRTFDVVYSLGFIEHFQNLEEIIRKHIALVRPGGTLFLSCPNFRGIQYVLHRVFDVENLRAHVVPTMNLRRWRRVLEANDMEVLAEGYYRTAGFWTYPNPKGFLGAVSGSITRVAGYVDDRFHLPTPWLSPHMYSISRKAPNGHGPTDAVL